MEPGNKPVSLSRLGLKAFPDMADTTSDAITKAVEDYAKYKYENHLWIGENPQGLVDAALAAEGKIRDRWDEDQDAIMEDVAKKGQGVADAKARLIRNGIPTSETARKAAARQQVQKDSGFMLALTTWRTTMTELAIREEKINAARRRHSAVMYAWRQAMLLAYSAVDTNDKARLQSIMDGVMD